MPAELLDLVLDEVSVVDEPANKDARVVLLKRASGGSATMDNAEKVGLVQRLLKMLGIGADELNKAEDDATMDAATQKRFDELKAEIEKLRGERDADGIAKAITEALKSDNPGERLDELEKQVKTLVEKAGDKDARIAELEKKLADARDAAKKDAETAATLKGFRESLPKQLQKPFDEMDDEEKRRFMDKFKKGIEKSDDPVAKALATVTKENESLKSRISKLEGDADKRAARAEVADLAGITDVDKAADVLVRLRKSDPDAAEAYLESLRATAKRVETSTLFKELGSRADKHAESDLTKAVTKYAAEHNVTEAEATEKVLEKHPELYTKYLEDEESA